MFKYYSTQRPITPGSYSKQDGKEIIENYDSRRYIVSIGRFAWGHIEFTNPLTEKQISDYELVPCCGGFKVIAPGASVISQF